MALFLSLPVRQLVQLRSELHAKEKNAEMMRRLWEQDWFVRYRADLEKYRAGKGSRPVFPNNRVEEVEKEVDKWMEAKYRGYKR